MSVIRDSPIQGIHFDAETPYVCCVRRHLWPKDGPEACPICPLEDVVIAARTAWENTTDDTPTPQRVRLLAALTLAIAQMAWLAEGSQWVDLDLKRELRREYADLAQDAKRLCPIADPDETEGPDAWEDCEEPE